MSTCAFCGDGGYAFCPQKGHRDVWVPCPRCSAGAMHELTPQARAILGDTDWRAVVVPLPGGPMYDLMGPAEEPSTPQQAKRMVDAIVRTFHTGERNPEKQLTAREREQERRAA